jgi:hypothetical protein
LTSCQINPTAAALAAEELVAETLGTAEVVTENVVEAGEISRASICALLIVGGEVISVVTSTVAAEVVAVVVIIAAVETSGVAAEVVAFRALESLSITAFIASL